MIRKVPLLLAACALKSFGPSDIFYLEFVLSYVLEPPSSSAHVDFQVLFVVFVFQPSAEAFAGLYFSYIGLLGQWVGLSNKWANLTQVLVYFVEVLG